MKALTIRIMSICLQLTGLAIGWDKMPITAEWTITGSELGLCTLITILGFILWDKAAQVEED